MAECTDKNQQRKQWSSEPAFVFSMAAAAIGLGNIWRFPYMVGENGGAAFILAYLLALVIVALPIMMLEVGAGRLAQGSSVDTFRQAHKRWGALYGWLVVVLTLLITSYYLVITGWTLGYAVNSLAFRLADFEQFTAGYNSLWYFLVTLGLATLVLIKGVSAIEKFSKLLMPVLLLVIVLLVVVASQMDGWDKAKDFMLRADLSMLKDERLWFFAFGQAFYTLAIGQGYLVTYGSYIPRKTHVPRACLIVAGTETTIALLAGWMIFPYVFTYGMDPGQGSELAFNTLPEVFNRMQGGWLLAILFFNLFFLAAFSSCLAGMKVVIAAVEEEFRMTSNQSVLAVALLIMFLGVPSALSFSPVQLTVAGMPFLDFMDQFGGTNVVIASGIIGAGLFAWLVPRKKIHSSLSATSRWWELRILIIGRSLPFLAVIWLVWRMFF